MALVFLALLALFLAHDQTHTSLYYGDQTLWNTDTTLWRRDSKEYRHKVPDNALALHVRMYMQHCSNPHIRLALRGIILSFLPT